MVCVGVGRAFGGRKRVEEVEKEKKRGRASEAYLYPPDQVRDPVNVSPVQLVLARKTPAITRGLTLLR